VADEPVPYTLSITPVEVDEVLEAGQPVEVDLEAGESAVYGYDLARADDSSEVDVLFGLDDGDGQANLEVFDPLGFPVSVTSTVDPVTLYTEGEYVIVVTAEEAGTYTVGVSEGGGIVPPPDSLSGIDEVDIGEVARFTFEEGDIADVVFVGRGAAVRVAAAGEGGGFDPVLSVYDENLEFVGGSAGDPDERRAVFEFFAESGVTYVVSVADVDGAAGDVRILVNEP
jgi:hypothetical protein